MKHAFTVTLRGRAVGGAGVTKARLRLALYGLSGARAAVSSELPPAATRDVVREAYRVLRPGGQLWVTEMDFETEGFRKLRASPDYALVAAKDGGPAAFVDRREATKLPDTHLKTWESKSKS